MRKPEAQQENAPARPRALVVDDHDMIRALAARVLSDGGWEVDTAGNISGALAARPLDFDVLVIDVRLGAERGTDLLAELRATDPAVPARCLVLSGDPADPTPDDVTVLLKPFRAEDLVAAVNRLARRPPAGGGAR